MKKNKNPLDERCREPWDIEKNLAIGLIFENVTKGMGRKAWWKCPIHGGYQQEIRLKANGKGCPFCAGKQVHILDCLETTHPEIAKQWHPTLNGILTPKNVTIGSNKIVWWYCEKHKEAYLQKISNKKRGSGCPYCSGQKVHKSTCLETLYPEIAKLWHPTLNKNLTAKDVTAGSQRKVWWICPIHGEYQQIVKNKVYGEGCPRCNESKGEKSIAKYLTKKKIRFIRQHKFNDCKYKSYLYFDFGIFDHNKKINLLIEYDGEQHFKEVKYFGGEKKLNLRTKRDNVKNKYCEDNKIPLLRIPYWSCYNIESILSEVFEKHKDMNESDFYTYIINKTKLLLNNGTLEKVS